MALLTAGLPALPARHDECFLLDTSSIPSLPGGAWPEPSSTAVAVPLSSDNEERKSYLVVGVSSRLAFDREYESHVRGIARQLDSARTSIAARRERDAADRGRNNLLLQAPVAAALMVGPSWNYQVSNTLYEQMVGRKVVGRNWHDIFPELSGGPVEAILRGVYERGEPFIASEQLVPLARERDGVVEERFFDFNMIPIHDHSGAVGAMMVVAVEMTAQVLARRELERTGWEREKLLTELESANRAKDEFLAMLGHELRNPLSPIVTALALMKLREALPGREGQIIERQVTHLVRLVDDLLDISKITRGKIELRKEEFLVSDVLAEAVDIASDLFERRHHELVVEVPHGVLWYGDPIRLAQVVSNLLTNAARYTPAGGKIRLAAVVEGAELVIRVEDNGVGLAKEALSRVFDLFYQGNRSSDRSEGGLGLGLALVKNLVAMHGGTAIARSEGLGLGSTFEVRLPIVAPENEETVVAARPSASTNEPKKILIVDDNEDAADLLAEILRSMHHEVIVANDPVTALSVAPPFAPQLALLDIGLPVMDGYELAAKLRGVLTVECRMIALTGYGQNNDRDKSMAAGFSDHLVKPVDLAKLMDIVGSHA